MPVKAKDWSKATDKALELIAQGESVTKACEKAKIAKTTFLGYVDSDRYARARDAQADVHFDEMLELERKCLNKGIDPQVYRVTMDTRKWRLARMRPAVYGERSQVDHTSSDGSMTPRPAELKVSFTDDEAEPVKQSSDG